MDEWNRIKSEKQIGIYERDRVNRIQRHQCIVLYAAECCCGHIFTYKYEKWTHARMCSTRSAHSANSFWFYFSSFLFFFFFCSLLLFVRFAFIYFFRRLVSSRRSSYTHKGAYTHAKRNPCICVGFPFHSTAGSGGGDAGRQRRRQEVFKYQTHTKPIHTQRQRARSCARVCLVIHCVARAFESCENEWCKRTPNTTGGMEPKDAKKEEVQNIKKLTQCTQHTHSRVGFHINFMDRNAHRTQALLEAIAYA